MADPRVPAPHDPGTCLQCFFSEADADGNLRCHRSNPPSNAGTVGIWPMVQPNDWCGEGWYNGYYYTPDGNRP